MGKYKVGDFVVVAHDDSLVVVVELSIERERWEEEMPSRVQHQDKRGELEEDERKREGHKTSFPVASNLFTHILSYAKSKRRHSPSSLCPGPFVIYIERVKEELSDGTNIVRTFRGERGERGRES